MVVSHMIWLDMAVLINIYITQTEQGRNKVQVALYYTPIYCIYCYIYVPTHTCTTNEV